MATKPELNIWRLYPHKGKKLPYLLGSYLQCCTTTPLFPVPKGIGEIFFQIDTDATHTFKSENSETKQHGGLANLWVATDGGITKVSSEEEVNVLTADGQTTIPSRPSIISFDGSGWGHGVGMSQHGARQMAREGYTYREILEFYYRQIDIG